MVSQIAQISQYMFLNYHRLHRFRNYTSGLKSYRGSGFEKKLTAWWQVSRGFSVACQWRTGSALEGDKVVCEGGAAW